MPPCLLIAFWRASTTNPTKLNPITQIRLRARFGISIARPEIVGSPARIQGEQSINHAASQMTPSPAVVKPREQPVFTS
jgi:hypothetical protein